MDPNGRILQELVNSVRELKEISREQRKTNEEQRRFNDEQRRFNDEQRRANARYDGLIEEQRQEHKAMERRWQKMFLDHEKWMRDHEVRLRSNYKLIQDTREKLR